MYSGADLKSEAFNEYCRWMRVKSMDPDTRREIQAMITNMDMIYERFSSRLSFGTAGLRAPLGAGTNRMNLYTVAAAARGFARWIKARGGADKGIVISYDSRNQSEAFAEMTARMAADEGVQVYLSDTLRPVPMLSYAINLYGAAGGVMITASHNPAEYNGFKAYGSDGAQLMPEAAAEVSTAIEQVGDIFSVINDSLTFRQLRHNGMIEYAGANLDYRYDNLILEKLRSDQVPEEAKKNLRIVYTPLNGAGNHHVRRLLGKLGFETVAVVPEQELPDGDFPSLRVPNPEYEDTFDKAIELAKVTMADLIIATDPDSDRLGVAVPDQDGEYCVLTGNQIGTLLMEYILGSRTMRGAMKENSFCIASIVSTKIPRYICRRYGLELKETLTGSRFTAQAIREGSEAGQDFVFGFEEGNGYMFSTGILDKDGVAAAIVFAQMAAMSKSVGQRLYDQLRGIYSLYKYPAEKNFSIKVEGSGYREKMNRAMDRLRSMGRDIDLGPQTEIIELKDYQPETDMLYYNLEGGGWMAVRPSGTEPKIKIYVGLYGAEKSPEEEAEALSAKVYRLIDSLLKEPDISGDNQ